MLAKRMLSQIVDDERLTRGLGDPEARMLVEWLVDQAEDLSAEGPPEEVLGIRVTQLCRRARAVSRFVCLWCHENSRGAAFQLAAVERFSWPLPTTMVDPYELMQEILGWERQILAQH